MGAKWTTVSTANYADGSPSDDGSATEANRVKFATIKSDLTDPLDTAIDSIVSNLDEVFDTTTTAIATNYTTVASDHAKILEVTDGIITLLAAATAGSGYRVGVYGSGASITVQRSSTDTIDGATSVVVRSGNSAAFTVNAAGNGYISDAANQNRIATGTYTGDGSTNQAITGLGFSPKFVKVVPRETVNATAVAVMWTTDVIVDDNASGGAITENASVVNFNTDTIRAIGADGFSVDDGGSDQNPNKTSQVYNYIAIG